MFAVTVAGGVSLIAALLEVRTGLQLTDESWVWYGVQRTIAGEVPIGDFQSYDPGRYLWSAAWSPILGDGIIAMRNSTWIFAAIGLAVGLVVIQRIVRSFGGVLAFGLMVVPWMIPRHKRFDFVLAFPAILAGLWMIERRDDRSHLYAGIVAGAGAFIGRNEGVYMMVGFGLLALYLAPRQPRVLLRRIAILCAGSVIGYTPMFILSAVRPQVLREFIALNLDVLRRGTNAPLPMPWPWRADDLFGVLVGLLFIVVPALYLFTLVRLWRRRRSLDQPYEPLMLAAATLGLPALHHAFSHAEINHLSQVIAPFLVLVVVYALYVGRTLGRRNTAVAILVTLALVTALVPLSRWRVFHSWMDPDSYQTVSIGGDELVADFVTACHYEFVKNLDQVAGDDAIFIAPRWPGAYAAMERRSPHYYTYMVWTRNKAWQRGVVEDLEREDVRWAWIHNRPSFRRSHPLVFKYIEKNFTRVAIKGQPLFGGLFARDRTVPPNMLLDKEQPGPCPAKKRPAEWQEGWW